MERSLVSFVVREGGGGGSRLRSPAWPAGLGEVHVEAPGRKRLALCKPGARRPERSRGPVLLVGLGLVAQSLAAQSAGAVPPGYHAGMLDGGQFRQEVRSVIELESGRLRSRERGGRDGVLRLEAKEEAGRIRLEAWFDSLALWREGDGVRLVPETDGVIGGRFRGLLDRDGGLTVTDLPFVPDEVAQVSDLSDVLEGLLPPLAPAPLPAGGVWRDEAGALTIRRLPDGRRGGRVMARYLVEREARGVEPRLLPDSTLVEVSRVERESGVVEWDGERGPVRWERTIAVEVEVPGAGPVGRPFRTRIEQQVVVERLTGAGVGGQPSRSR